MPSATSMNHLRGGTALVLGLALLRAGIGTALLVILCSGFLLTNPWIRTLLELPQADGKSHLSRFDPAAYLSALTGVGVASGTSSDDAPAQEDDQALRGGKSVTRKEGTSMLTLSVMPIHLRRPVDAVLRLVVRDFVCYWYDPISLSSPEFPTYARRTIDHFAATVYKRTSRLKNVDVTSEMLLTTTSVLLSSLRRRRAMLARNAKIDADDVGVAPPDTRFPTTAARIDVLRKAVRNLLSCSLPKGDSENALLMSLMTELLTKQLWQGVQTVGDPDFINRQIVAYGTPAPPQAEAPSPELVQAATAAVGSDTDEVTGPVEGSFASSSGPSGPESSNARAEPAKRLSRPSRPPSVPPTLPKRPPPKASSIDAEIPSSGPFDAIGGLATAAVGSVASAATKTVEVLGAAAEETGKALAGDNTDERGFANANSSDVSRTSSASGSAQTAVKRKPPPSVGPPVMHMDIPPSAGVDVPLPESLRPRQSKQADEDVTGYSIREPDAADGANSVGPSSRGPSSTRASPAPEPRDSAGPRGQNRSSSTVQPANAPSGSSRPPLAFVLSRKDPSLYDAFENYCERFSTQGETLLRLHTQLDTLAAISRMTEQDPEMFRQDAQVILVKACEGLAQGPSGHASTDEDETLRRERTASVLRNTLERLGHRADLSVLQPAVDEVHERLESLFEAFWIRTHQSRTEERMRVEQPTSVPGMSYEPRRKPSAPTQTSRPVPPVPTAAIDSSAQAHQTIASAARASQPDATIADQPTSSVRQSLDANNGAVLSIGRQSGGSDQLEVSVTDVSPNAEVSGPVDPRTLELMVAVEGLAAAGGGFVLMRTFAEFERLDADLRRALPGPRRVPLPSARGKTSATICRDVERYIVAVLSDALHVSSAPVQAFFDKTKAGAPVAAIRMRMAGLGPNALFSGLQKSIASGVGAVGKGAKSLQLPARSSSPFSAGQEPLNRSPTRATAAGDVDGYLSRSREQGRSSQRNSWSETSQPASQSQPQQQPQMTTGSGPQSGSASANSSDRSSREKQVPSPPVEAELSAKDLNDMLAAIFAVADEALNLTGGWSLRRGMLRVLEQIVRTQYSGTIISTFNHAAHSLNSESIADWIEAGKEGVWPGGEWSTAPSASANRTTEEVQETARKAKEIVLSYAPTQAGYVLGPGGGQACCAALEAVHAALVDPVTATDLATELTLRALRMATA